MISRISLSRFYHVHNLNMYVCERSPKQRELESAHVQWNPFAVSKGAKPNYKKRYSLDTSIIEIGFIKSQETRALCGRVARSIFLSFSRHLSSLQSWMNTVFSFFFFPLNKLSIEHVSASAQIFPFRWISRLVHYGGMEIAWNCRLRMQIGYTSVWNEPLSWWNHGELIRGQYCVKGFFHCLFFDNRIERNEWRKETSCNWISRNFCYNLWDLNVMRRRKKVMVNISFSNFGMVWRKLSSKITGQDL